MYNISSSEIRVRDPYIVPVKETGKYYLFGTTDTDPWNEGEGFLVYESEDLENWSEPRWAFLPPEGFWANQNFWAPEVHFFNGYWYIFASFKANGVCRGTQILRSESVTGPYVPISEGPVTPRHWECLDGTLHVDEKGKPWMVFCHEWVQVHDGEICCIPLSDDLTHAIGEPTLLFRASEAPWVVPLWNSMDNFVTDGPFLYRSSNGALRMLWSSFSTEDYTISYAESQSGTIFGPWIQHETGVVVNGGHGMVFDTFDGRTLLSIHSPNGSPMERMKLIPFEK